MTIHPKVSFAFAGAAISLFPSLGMALESQYTEAFNAASETCASAESSPDCLQTLLPLLSEVRAEASGAQYDIEIAAMALAIVNAYRNLPAPTPQACAVLANALEETGKSAVDQAQAGQIFAVAAQIRSCSGLGNEVGRLLASPN